MIKNICLLCNKKINLQRENYVKVVDYKEGKFYGEGFYHNKCYIDRINNGPLKTKFLQNMASSLLERASNLMDKAEGKDTEVEFVKHGK